MPGALAAGLYQKVKGGVWYVRRRVPDDLRAQFGHEFKASMGTSDVDLATARRERWWAERDQDITLARAAGATAVAKLDLALRAIEAWREGACLDAARPRHAPPPPATPTFIQLPDGSFSERRQWPPAAKLLCAQNDPWEMVNALANAQAFFDAHPEMSREPGLPADTAWLLERLEAVATAEGDWRRIEGFDLKLDGALALGGLSALVLPQVRDGLRVRFACAWAEVLRHQELQRRRAALVLAADEAISWTKPADIRVPPPATAYLAQAGDKTLGDVIKAVRIEKARGKTKEAGEAYVRKNYEHVFRALEEVIGSSTPIRALRREDVRELRTLFERLPANASKIYPGMPLVEAADRAESEGRALISPNTARGYLVNLSALCNFAKDEGWVEKNPCNGLIPGRRDSVRHRGFDLDELQRLFASLEDERYSERWWILAILAFSGARASEICQLLTEDVKAYEGLAYLDFSCFDAAGRRLDAKKMKTEASERAAPIHPELIRVGFLDLVEARRDAGVERLFPSMRHHPLNGYSGDLSKWFGRRLDALELSQPSLVMHSFRHGFREAGRRMKLSDEIIDALGGWAPKSVGEKYGSRTAVPDNTVHMACIELNGFQL